MTLPQKAQNINCTHCSADRCTHHAAPRKLFGAASCVLINQIDPRITTCAWQQPYRRPLPPPTPIHPKHKRGCPCNASQKGTAT